MQDTRAELLRKLEKVDPEIREIILLFLQELDRIAEECEQRLKRASRIPPKGQEEPIEEAPGRDPA